MRATNAVTREHDPSPRMRRCAPFAAPARNSSAPILLAYTMYSTCEPCPMCMANALWAGLDRVVYGATIADANRHCLQIQIPAKEVARRSDMHCKVEGPVLRELCNSLFTHPKMLKAFRKLEYATKRYAASAGPNEESARMLDLITLLDWLRCWLMLAASSPSPKWCSSFRAISTGIRRYFESNSTAKLPTLVVQPLNTAEVQIRAALLPCTRSGGNRARCGHRKLRAGSSVARRCSAGPFPDGRD